MATVRLLAVSETFRRAPYYLTPKLDTKTKQYATGQDIQWKIEREDDKEKIVLATDEDVKKAKNLPFIIDPNESYYVRHNMTFNLDVPADKVLLDFIKTYPGLVANKKSEIISGRHRYYIEDQEDEAKETITKIEAEFNAISEVRKMSLEEMQAFARVVGVGKVGNLTKTQVEAALLEKCKSQPAYIISALKDPNRKVKAFLKLLVEKNIVRHFNGKYQYGNEILGLNETAAIDFLKAEGNKNLVSEFGRLLKNPEEKTAETAIA